MLAALPTAAYARLRLRLTDVTLAAGDVLSEPGARIRHVYFPRSAMSAPAARRLLTTEHRMR